MRVLIAPSGFKESLSAEAVASAIGRGVRAAGGGLDTIELPLVDGGEGFTATLVRTTGGTLHPVRVTGPVGDPVEAHVGVLGGDGPRTAIVEMAAAAGLALVPRDRRDPLETTTYGVGELFKAALDLEPGCILVGCGDSGTNDGGAGMAEALGIRLLKSDGTPIGRGGAALVELDRLDLTERDPRLDRVRIDVACNIHNILCGPRGVARVFGPQKGASPETVARLEAALDRFAEVVERDVGVNVRDMPGSGASGGLGAGLHALLGATLHSRFDIVTQYLDLDGALRHADLVITAEGGIDFQTPRGKIPAEVARRAKTLGLPVIALVGTVGKGAEATYDLGIDAFVSVLAEPETLEDARSHSTELVRACAENMMRAVLIGCSLGASHGRGAGRQSTTPLSDGVTLTDGVAGEDASRRVSPGLPSNTGRQDGAG